MKIKKDEFNKLSNVKSFKPDKTVEGFLDVMLINAEQQSGILPGKPYAKISLPTHGWFGNKNAEWKSDRDENSCPTWNRRMFTKKFTVKK